MKMEEREDALTSPRHTQGGQAVSTVNQVLSMEGDVHRDHRHRVATQRRMAIRDVLPCRKPVTADFAYPRRT